MSALNEPSSPLSGVKNESAALDNQETEHVVGAIVNAPPKTNVVAAVEPIQGDIQLYIQAPITGRWVRIPLSADYQAKFNKAHASLPEAHKSQLYVINLANSVLRCKDQYHDLEEKDIEPFRAVLREIHKGIVFEQIEPGQRTFSNLPKGFSKDKRPTLPQEALPAFTHKALELNNGNQNEQIAGLRRLHAARHLSKEILQELQEKKNEIDDQIKVLTQPNQAADPEALSSLTSLRRQLQQSIHELGEQALDQFAMNFCSLTYNKTPKERAEIGYELLTDKQDLQSPTSFFRRTWDQIRGHASERRKTTQVLQAYAKELGAATAHTRAAYHMLGIPKDDQTQRGHEHYLIEASAAFGGDVLDTTDLKRVLMTMPAFKGLGDNDKRNMIEEIIVKAETFHANMQTKVPNAQKTKSVDDLFNAMKPEDSAPHPQQAPAAQRSAPQAPAPAYVAQKQPGSPGTESSSLYARRKNGRSAGLPPITSVKSKISENHGHSNAPSSIAGQSNHADDQSVADTSSHQSTSPNTPAVESQPDKKESLQTDIAFIRALARPDSNNPEYKERVKSLTDTQFQKWLDDKTKENAIKIIKALIELDESSEEPRKASALQELAEVLEMTLNEKFKEHIKEVQDGLKSNLHTIQKALLGDNPS